MPLADAGLAILVVDTRVSHALVDGGYASRRADCETACRELGVPSLREATLDRVEALTDARIRRRARHVVTEIDRVAQAVDGARERPTGPTVGELFVASHASMRDDFEISCPELDVRGRGGPRRRRDGRADDRRRLRRLGRGAGRPPATSTP